MLKGYFAENDGSGILSTADREGRVNAAIYSKPHIIEEETIALLMSERLSYANLQVNPYAVYLFMETGPGWKGKRIYLKKVKEEHNTDLAKSLIRRTHVDKENLDVNLVYFQIEKVLPLIGE
ncbi:MAG: pyridoxamine 5'-phosphate oxidase family protein [Syntrophomonadaceae bacterium]|jgi:hypothetical protein|nr:pyridoxamine 5'-phosphate oxidase family protein [Syntrophomonadaceae bacterium]